MDAAGLAEDEVSEAYGVLRRVNRQLGNQHTMERELRRYLREEPRGAEAVTILDVGSGSGDIRGRFGNGWRRGGSGSRPWRWTATRSP
jgi:ubiquinone/menaquinone biosynthesis C-methylase UbiE